MAIGQHIEFRQTAGQDHQMHSNEVVLGLHWDPPQRAVVRQPADLDALCVLFDADGRMLEVIHPGHVRSADGNVIHTGDSRNGASHWDDERIFVFLEGLPQAVVKLAFFILSVSGRPFDGVPGARCHVSDRISELPLVEVDLTALSGRTMHTVSVLRRDVDGWEFAGADLDDEVGIFATLHRLVKTAK